MPLRPITTERVEWRLAAGRSPGNGRDGGFWAAMVTTQNTTPAIEAARGFTERPPVESARLPRAEAPSLALDNLSCAVSAMSSTLVHGAQGGIDEEGLVRAAGRALSVAVLRSTAASRHRHHGGRRAGGGGQRRLSGGRQRNERDPQHEPGRPLRPLLARRDRERPTSPGPRPTGW